MVGEAGSFVFTGALWLGRGAHLLLALSEQEDEQGLREVVRQRGSVRLRRNDTAYGKASSPWLRISKQFLHARL
jgi:hypothetical protein